MSAASDRVKRFLDQPAQDWIAASAGRVLGVCPDTRHGLTPAFMDAIENFVKEHQ